MSIDPAPAPVGSEAIWQGNGEITASNGNSFTVDTCPPDADCSADTSVQISIESPDFSAAIPLGAYVTVNAVTWDYNAGAKGAQLSVRNLPSWDGIGNPVAGHDRWYLLLSEGRLEHPFAPFELASVELGCPPRPEADGRVFDLAFSDASGSETRLSQGEVATFDLAGQTWTVKTVRAFSSYNLDGTDPFSWWAVSAAE